MKKILFPFTLILLILFSAACSNKKNQSFAIYISEDEQSVDINTATKILGVEDIIVYDWENHEILVTEDAAKRFNELKPPVNGLFFTVFLGEEAVYDGYIWPFYSSLSYDGIIIQYPVFTENMLNILTGYPGDAFFSGKDHRDDQRIYESLLQDGKIKS